VIPSYFIRNFSRTCSTVTGGWSFHRCASLIHCRLIALQETTALCEESSEVASHPKAVIAQLLAEVSAKTQGMAAIADHLIARAQAASRLIGTPDNIQTLDGQNYLRVDSGVIDTALRARGASTPSKVPQDEPDWTR
jgi:hypothetical protein